MKILNKLKFLSLVGLLLAGTACKKEITDFGFDSAISGTVKEQNGNLVPGNITSNNLVVKALGKRDKVTMDLRVDGNGFFQNTKLYPQEYKIWVSGPVTLVGDTIRANLASEKILTRDLNVIPFISINKPAVVGSPTASAIEVSYDLAANSGKTIAKRELYCSTNPFPDASTGSGPYFSTKTVAITNNKGNVSVTGLAAKTKYFIRVGAQATGAGFNYSEQIVVTTP